MTLQVNQNAPVRIGISSCLLGNEVRYDGGHRRNDYITLTLAKYFEFVPYCPEVAIGLGIPRAPIQLVRRNDQILVRGVDDPDLDVTEALAGYARKIMPQIDGLSGYIFKRGSPSCGVEKVKVYNESTAAVEETGVGEFAYTLMKVRPEMPIEDEVRLMDPRLRDNFIERVFLLHRWRCHCKKGLTFKALEDFHRRIKYSVLVHGEQPYQDLAQLLAERSTMSIEQMASAYLQKLMLCMGEESKPEHHARVLMRICGHFDGKISAHDKKELLELLDAYCKEQLPLIVPMTMIRHHLGVHPNRDIELQFYTYPYASELMLRSRI